jgi:hypothetical protein
VAGWAFALYLGYRKLKAKVASQQEKMEIV